MEAALKKENPNLEVILMEGDGGKFEVTLDGNLIFSRRKEGRFPEHDEIISKLSR